MNTQGLTPEQVRKLEEYQASGAHPLVLKSIENKFRLFNATQSQRKAVLKQK